MTDKEIISQFPIFDNLQDGKRLVYLDTGATAQRPRAVIEAVDNYYRTANANPHRGVYGLSEAATEAYESSRRVVADFIHAEPEQVIFTRNTSEALNLIAYSWGLSNLHAGDRVVATVMEHHSNLIPWQQVCHATGAELVLLYPDKDGHLSDEEIHSKIISGTRLVACAHVSNVLGLELPVQAISQKAHEVGAITVLDAAQSVPHIPLDVSALDADFIAFSGHKIYSPFGIGVLWGRKDLLEEMPPFLTGGDMIDSVREQDATWAPLPQKFEAGTQNVGGAVGLAAAIEWMKGIGYDEIERRERDVYDYARQQIAAVPHVTVYGNGEGRHYGAVSFNVEDVHPHDVATIVDADAICIRAGHHCAQPLMHFMGINVCCRASIGVYNTREDIDRLTESLKKVRKWLGYES